MKLPLQGYKVSCSDPESRLLDDSRVPRSNSLFTLDGLEFVRPSDAHFRMSFATR